MAQLLIMGAQLQCSFGTTPSSLSLTPEKKVNASGQPAGTVMDHVPNKNIMPFGMCTTVSNPQVASATAAAQGVLTPQPCVPVTTSRWIPGSPTVNITSQKVLNNSCTLNCGWGGVITVSQAGQQTVNVA